MVAKFFRRSGADRALLLRAVGVHAATAILLRLWPYGRVRALLESWFGKARVISDPDEAERRVLWAVRTATVLVPIGRTCLTEALTAQVLLRRYGCDASVRFGVRLTGTTAPVAAHAWLQREGRLLLGGSESAAYVTLEPAREES